MNLKVLILIVSIVAIYTAPILGQSNSVVQDSYTIQAHQVPINKTIILDGSLSESAWLDATPITNFRQQVPTEGGNPTERTEIRIIYDDNNLYIGAILFDSEPSKILAFQKRWDQSLGADDRFMWILDTFNDGRNAYFFEINPAGLMGDGLITVGQGINISKAWNGIWEANVKVTDIGWIAEIRIPFKTLDFNADQTEWGINFQRTVRRRSEEILWAGWRLNQGLFRPQDSGKLTGLKNLNQGIGLEIKPYSTVKPTRTFSSNSPKNDDFNADAGVDITYSITPSFRTSLSVNTDFAESEVDQRRVNLTRFPLVFPEQRSFFLEGSNIFNFAQSSSANPFFSRRIGLVNGSPVPILFGLRAVGRAGNTNIGLYQIRTAKSDVNEEDFTVARITQNIFKESRIGILYTRRATMNDDLTPVRETFGTDFEIATSTFMGNKNLQLQMYFIGHTLNDLNDSSEFMDRTARGFRLSFPNFPFYGHTSYREFGTAYNPAVGIAPRNGFRRLQPVIGYTKVLSNHRIIRSLTTEIRYTNFMDMDFKPESIEFIYQPIEIVLESGDAIEFQTGFYSERLTEDFDIQRNGKYIISTGTYKHPFFRTEINSASYRLISTEFSFLREGYWNGTRTEYSGRVTVRPFIGVNITANWSREDIDLDSGSFYADVYRFRGNIDLTPFTSYTSIIQYDNLSQLMGLYQRFHWIITPGTNLYLVYTWNWQELNNRFTPLETSGSIKLSYTHRF